MRRILSYLSIAATLIVFSSCLTVLSGIEKISIEPDHPETQVSILESDGFVTYSHEELESIRLPRLEKVAFIKMEREGCPTTVVSIEPQGINYFRLADGPIAVISGIMFLNKAVNEEEGAQLAGAVALASGYGFLNYNAPWKVFRGNYQLPDMQSYPERKEGEQQIGLKTVDIELAEGDLITEFYYTWKAYRKSRPGVSRFSDEEIKVEKSVFMDELKYRLAKTGYIDTSAKVFSSRFVETTLSANLQNAKTKIIGSVLQVSGEIEWILTDEITGRELAKYDIESSSSFSFFESGSNGIPEAMREAMASMFENSMLEFLEKPKIKRKLQEKGSSFDAIYAGWDTLNLNQKPDSIQSVGEALNAVVTIVDRKSHGSGVLVSKDGFIVTNHHVIAEAFADEKSLKVRFGDGSEVDAEIVRTNPIYDLALIKVEGDDFTNLVALGMNDIRIGSDVFAIGTPGSVDLGQTISKGIISGKRVDQERTVIQTDVSINGGNSGGALVYKDGTLIGIVNAKLVGFGVEGIGFAIPAEYIGTALKLDFQH